MVVGADMDIALGNDFGLDPCELQLRCPPGRETQDLGSLLL